MRLFVIFFLSVLFATHVCAQDDIAYKRLSNQANTYYKNGDFKLSAETLESAIKMKGRQCGYMEVYNAACSWALAGYPDSAFKHLDYLASSLITDPQGYMGKTNMDPYSYILEKDFTSLHKDERWDKLIDRLKRRKTPLANKLDTIYFDDQGSRRKIREVQKEYGASSKEMEQLWAMIHIQDSSNQVKIKQLLDSLGWPSIDTIGKRGSNAIFLVIQHSDIKMQERYLPLMRQAVKKGNAKGSQLAMLEDRVALAKGEMQVYGSQIMKYGDGEWFLQPLVDPDNVDERRKTVGLARLASYLKNWDMVWDVEEYKKQLPEIEKKMREHGWGKENN